MGVGEAGHQASGTDVARGLLDSIAAGEIMALPTEGANVERCNRTGDAIADQRATRGTPGIARRAPASITPRSNTPSADCRRPDRHDHREPQADPRKFGRASRARQAERRAHARIREPAYGEGSPNRTATSRPLTAPDRGSPHPGEATLPTALPGAPARVLPCRPGSDELTAPV